MLQLATGVGHALLAPVVGAASAAVASGVAAGRVVTNGLFGSGQSPPVQGVSPGTSVPIGRARWTVPAAAFSKETCRFDAVYFAQLEKRSGRNITYDACASSTSQALAKQFCSSVESFLRQDCQGQHVWLDPPAGREHDLLQHYLACKSRNPATTSAIVVVKKDQQLKALLQGMTLLKTFSRGTRLYTAISGGVPQPGIPHPVQVWFDPPAKMAAGKLYAVEGSNPVTVLSEEVNSMQFTGELAGAKARVHVDTGATHSFVASHFIEKHGLAVVPAARTVALADGNTVPVTGTCKARLQLDNIQDVHSFLVLSLDSTYDVLLGQDWLRRKAAVLDFGNRSMSVSHRDSPRVIHAGEEHGSSPGGGEGQGDTRISALQLKKLARKRGAALFLVVVKPIEGTADAKCASAAVSIETDDNALIPKKRLQRILDKYKAVFEDLPSGIIRRPGLPEMEIDFEPGKQPPPGYQYRLSQPEREELVRQLELALTKGWIEPSSSPFGAAVLFAKKKGGGLRMCLDYRAVNAITVKNRYPLPRIDDLLDQLNGASVFTGLDLAAGYWQIPVKEEDKYKTSFRTPMGMYQWKVMPFGLTNAPALFARTMQQVFHDMIGKFVLIYLDDILIFSKTPEEHEQHLALVLERLEQHKFYAQLRKCHFALPEVEFLGHLVSKDGIRVDPRKVKIVQEWPVPKSAGDLRSFLGLANYFRRFIEKYSETARCLHALTGKHAVWNWTALCQRAFEEIKEKLTAAPVLRAPDFTKPFDLVADASDFTIGAALLQDGQPVAFESRKLTPAEVNYYTGEKELLAVVHALTVWRCYLDGAKFTIHSDHEPLSYLRTKPTLTPRQVRWSQFLERFDYSWVYKPGSSNVVADSLSRVRHASERGSGTGSLTGSGQASETVLDLLAAMHTRSKSQGGAKAQARVPAPVGIAKPKHVVRRGRKSKRDAFAVPQGNGSTKPAVPQETAKDTVVPVSEQVAAGMRDALLAAYEKYGKELSEVVARFSLRQTADGLWCRQQQVWVPTAELQQKCIKEMHDTPFSGHKGVTKTLAAVQKHYWWPGLRAAVTNYVTTCASCQRNKVQGKKPIGLLQPLEVPAEPWAEVTMDFITGLPCTTTGYDAVMVFCDRLTKMVHFAACTKTTDAVKAAKLFLDRVVAAHGLPVSIISDRDTRFKSEFWTSLMGFMGITHKMSSAFHPQTDGQTERVNRVLEEYLRHYVNPSQDDWDHWLPMAEFAYNNSVHEAVKETPFFLNYGLHPRVPGAVRTQLATVPAAAEEFATRMRDIVAKAKERLELARQRAMRISNPSRREAIFKVGDRVLLSSRNIAMKTPGTNKLLPKYVGPFPVAEVLSPVTYRLDLPASMKCHNVFHAGLLLEYKSDGREQEPPPPLEFDDGESGQWFEIDRVLKHRQVKVNRRTAVQFLVKWKGYGDEWNEWRDESGVTAAAVDEYWARVGGRPAPAAPPRTRGRRAGVTARKRRACKLAALSARAAPS